MHTTHDSLNLIRDIFGNPVLTVGLWPLTTCLIKWLASLTAMQEVLGSRNFYGNIGSGTGSTQPSEDNWVAASYEK